MAGGHPSTYFQPHRNSTAGGRRATLSATEVMGMAENQGPVTVVLSRSVKPGREADYQLWAKETTAAMGRFPGFLGAALNQPTTLNPRWVFMPRWESTEYL